MCKLQNLMPLVKQVSWPPQSILEECMKPNMDKALLILCHETTNEK